MWSSNSEARTSRFSGRFASGPRAVPAAPFRPLLRENLPRARRAMDAGRRRIACDRRPVRRGAAGGRGGARARLATISRWSERVARWRYVSAGIEASQLSGELADRFSSATLTTRIQLPVTAAALAVRRGDSARALELLDTVKPYDHAPAAEFWPRYLRGQAYLASERRARGRRPVPKHPRPSRRGPDLAAIPARASRPRSGGG